MTVKKRNSVRKILCLESLLEKDYPDCTVRRCSAILSLGTYHLSEILTAS